MATPRASSSSRRRAFGFDDEHLRGTGSLRVERREGADRPGPGDQHACRRPHARRGRPRTRRRRPARSARPARRSPRRAARRPGSRAPRRARPCRPSPSSARCSPSAGRGGSGRDGSSSSAPQKTSGMTETRSPAARWSPRRRPRAPRRRTRGRGSAGRRAGQRVRSVGDDDRARPRTRAGRCRRCRTGAGGAGPRSGPRADGLGDLLDPDVVLAVVDGGAHPQLLTARWVSSDVIGPARRCREGRDPAIAPTVHLGCAATVNLSTRSRQCPWRKYLLFTGIREGPFHVTRPQTVHFWRNAGGSVSGPVSGAVVPCGKPLSPAGDAAERRG